MSDDEAKYAADRGVGRQELKNFPRGIEILLKKAKVDPWFRDLLLQDPGAAAHSIELTLRENERRILDSTPRELLSTLIQRTFVPRHHARSFLTQKAPALLLLLMASTVVLHAGGSKGVEAGEIVRYEKEDATDRMTLIQTALEEYEADHGGYPSTQEWLTDANPLEGYITTTYLYDPWKRKFHYEGVEAPDGTIDNYRLESLGADPESQHDNITCPIAPELHGFDSSQ